MVKVFLDGASLSAMRDYGDKVSGFTTNPSLMHKEGVSSYREFSQAVLEAVKGKPVSFEVFADDIPHMSEQAHEISSWGENVYVKIPVINTKGESTAHLVRQLSYEGIKLNVTAIFTIDQISTVARSLIHAPAILSIFCGRIADTGRDPVAFITHALNVKHRDTQILWASTRELYNLKQAQQAGADIITMTPDLIKKMDLIGKDLGQYSLQTVTEFFEAGKGLLL